MTNKKEPVFLDFTEENSHLTLHDIATVLGAVVITILLAMIGVIAIIQFL